MSSHLQQSSVDLELMHPKVMSLFSDNYKDTKSDLMNIESLCSIGYLLSLFLNQYKAKQYQCNLCKYVYCELIKTKCDECQDTYNCCRECLDGYLNNTHLRCPIDENHQNVHYVIKAKCDHDMITNLTINCPTKNLPQYDTRKQSNCLWTGNLLTMYNHLSSQCQVVIKRCFYWKYGCNFYGVSHSLNKHYQENRYFHAELQQNGVDQQSKDIVYGYIKQMQQFENIPIDVVKLCLKFYYLREYFGEGSALYYTISDDKSTIINTYFGSNGMCYMNNWMHSELNKTFKSTFKINHCSSSPLWFGLVSKYLPKISTWNSNQNHESYFVSNRGVRYQKGIQYGTYTNRKYDFGKSGDTVYYTLNMSAHTFGLTFKGQSYILFTDIKSGKDIEYIFVLTLPRKGDSVTLINFDIQ